MKKAVRVLSAILIAASVFGLVGGGLALKDALGSKAYWEAASAGGDSIGMLEDGLNQLKDNEQAYLDGRVALEEGRVAFAEGQAQLEEGAKALEEGQKAYDEGVKTLEAGQRAYNEGAATLAQKTAEYNAGVKKLEDAAKQLEEGKKTLDEKEAEYSAGLANLQQAMALMDGLEQLQSGFTTWEQGYNGLKQFQQAAAAQGVTLPDPAASNADAYDTAITQMKAQVQQGLDAFAQLEQLKTQKSGLEAKIQEMQAAGEDTTELEAQLAQINAGIAQLEAALSGQDQAALTQQKAMLDQLTGVPQAVAQGQQQLASGTNTAVTGILGNEEMAAKLIGASGMSAAELQGTVNAMPNMDYATFDATMNKLMPLANQLCNGEGGLADQIAAGQQQLAEGRKQLDEGWETYNKGLAEYEAGKKLLEDGKKQLDEGRAKLANAYQQLQDGKKKLDDAAKQLEEGRAALEEGQKALDEAEQQLADGEAMLKQYEDGRAQVIDGLGQAMAMETYPGIPSISERLGDGFTFMKNDTDLDIDKGFEVVKPARDFAADTTAAVTKEITNKAVGAILTLVGSLAAAAAGVMGLVGKKTKGSGVLALVGAAAAVVGVILSATSGMTFSEIAGAAAPTLLTAGGVSTAVAGVAQSIPAMMAKPAVPQA